MTCTNCKKNVTLTTATNYVVKDYYPHQEPVKENDKGARLNNAKTPLNFNKFGDLCPKCLDLLFKNGTLTINKLKE